ncbi:ATP-dependent DNA helicase [methanogenic archaeon mixed culture ISO4-G1]|nr:ATP-dependent DNA helicase [methanogenic archaeon mixed culture ISO4-G1]
MATGDKTVEMNNEFGEQIELKGRQVECVNYSGASSLLIKGTAGSGKTLILAKIAKNLLIDYPPSDKKPQICIFVYTRSLHDAMIELLEANGISVAGSPGEEGEIGVYSIKKYISEICYSLECVPKGFQQILDKGRILVINEILDTYRKYPYHHHSYDLDAEFWVDELKWMFTNGIADEEDREKYLLMDRKGRCKKYKTRMSNSGRRAAFDLMITYNKYLFENKLYEWDRIHAVALKKLEKLLGPPTVVDADISIPSSNDIDDETKILIGKIQQICSKLDLGNTKKWATITDEEIALVNDLAIRLRHELGNSSYKDAYDFSMCSKNNPLLPPSINGLWSGEISIFRSKHDVQEIKKKIEFMQSALILIPGLTNIGEKEQDKKRKILSSNKLGDYLHRYILIDECQDISLADIRIFACLNIAPKMYIAMDRNQSLYGYQWSFKKDAGINTSVKKLDMTFRSTRQIDEFANDLKRIDDQALDEEDRYDNIMSDIEGTVPRVVSCRDRIDENDYILSIINAFSGKNMTTAIILPTNTMVKSYFSLISSQTKESVCIIGEPGATIMKPGVKISTIHKAKGLGFTNVIIPSFNKGTYPKSEESIINNIKKRKSADSLAVDSIEDALREEISDYRKLAYVAITRAKMNLIITYTNPSPFIAEFEREHYELLNSSNDYIEDSRIVKSPMESDDDARVKKALERSSIQQRYNPDNRVIPNDYHNLDVVAAIKQVGLGDRLVDNRDNHGKLFIIGGMEISSDIDELKKMGFKFKPTIPIKATNNRKAWLYEGRSGYVI